MVNQDFIYKVVKFFNEEDWEPKQGVYFGFAIDQETGKKNPTKECCPLATLLLSSGIELTVDEKYYMNYHRLAQTLKLNPNFCAGVSEGFDGQRHYGTSEQYINGYDTGVKLRELLLND